MGTFGNPGAADDVGCDMRKPGYVPEACARLGISRSAFYMRVRRGWNPEEALLTQKFGKPMGVSDLLRRWKRVA